MSSACSRKPLSPSVLPERAARPRSGAGPVIQIEDASACRRAEPQERDRPEQTAASLPAAPGARPSRASGARQAWRQSLSVTLVLRVPPSNTAARLPSSWHPSWLACARAVQPLRFQHGVAGGIPSPFADLGALPSQNTFEAQAGLLCDASRADIALVTTPS